MSGAVAVSRVPPMSEPLDFIRNNGTGRVHIAQYVPMRPSQPGWTEPERVSFAEGLAAMFSTPRVMLCGVRLLITGDIKAAPVSGDGFSDDDLCIACINALGDQSWRAFHPSNRSEQ